MGSGLEQRREDRGEHGHRTVHEPHHLVRVRARVRVRVRIRLRVGAPSSDRTRAPAPTRRVEDGVRGCEGPLGAPLGDAAAGGVGRVAVRRGVVDSLRAAA